MEEVDAPPQPKLTRSRSRAPKVEIIDEPEIKEIPPRPRSRSKKAPDPESEPVQEPVQEPVKKRVRKKPEPGTVAPKDVNSTSRRGPIKFTAHRSLEPTQPAYQPSYERPYSSPYEHLHGSNRFSHIMSSW